MQILPYIAVYFVLWWLTLFAVLPFGLKTQAEADDVVLGTVSSAPARFSGRRTFLMTTLVSAFVYFCWYILSEKFGYTIDSIPQFVPNFD